MADLLAFPPGPVAGPTPPPSTAEQLRQANHRLSVVNQELDVVNEQLLVANEQLLVANDQLRVYNEEIGAQAAALRQSEEATHRLNTELTLTNEGLLATIDDSLQATEFALAQALAQRQRLHRLLAEAPAMIAVLTGPDYVVELANDHFRALFGHRELVGQSLHQVVPELASHPFLNQLADVYRTGETITGTDVPVTVDYPPAGQQKQLFVTYSCQATRDGAGNLDGLLIFASEVTEQVAARAAIERQQQVNYQPTQALNKYLARANEELDAFVYAASHDLQSPLNNLDGLLQALREELPPTERSVPVARILELLHESVTRFQHTLTNLSAIARAQVEIGQPAVPLADVVQGVLLDQALPIAEAGTQVTVNVTYCPRADS